MWENKHSNIKVNLPFEKGEVEWLSGALCLRFLQMILTCTCVVLLINYLRENPIRVLPLLELLGVAWKKSHRKNFSLHSGVLLYVHIVKQTTCNETSLDLDILVNLTTPVIDSHSGIFYSVRPCYKPQSGLIISGQCYNYTHRADLAQGITTVPTV